MKETIVHRVKEVTLKDPILVEGLPGESNCGEIDPESLEDYLTAFDVTLAVLQTEEALRRVAYELATGQANPELRHDPLAFTCGPEGGITDGEYRALAAAGWQPVSLGRSILRAVTTPVALLGAVQFELGRVPGEPRDAR